MNRRIRRPHFLFIALVFAVACGKKPGATDDAGSTASDAEATASATVTVAGASDLVYAMADIIKRFEKQTGKKVKFIPGSTGKLAAQIKEGAPYDVFFAANITFVDEVIASGACAADTKATYARGRLALWTGEDDQPPVPADIKGVADKAFTRIAIANPEHAPYGMAAKQALEKSGVYDSVKDRLVFGANIKDTMELVTTKNADAAFLALALVIKDKGKYMLIPEELHRPLEQAMVVCTRGTAAEAGREFAKFFTSPEMKKVLEGYGFVVP